MRGSGKPGATWPVNGRICSITPNTNSRINAHRNSGIDNNKIEAKSTTGSIGVPRTRNMSRPPPTPRIAASTIAAIAS